MLRLDSGVTIIAKRDGVVDKIDGKRIVVKALKKIFQNLELIFIIYLNFKNQIKILL